MPRVDDPEIRRGEDALGRFEAARLSDAGGLTQFGAIVETLWPGGRSSKTHWHRTEDEMVLMLEGEAVLIEGETETPMRAGQAACFKAGVPVGHHLENRSDRPIRYLVIGTRSGDEVVTYTADGSTVTTRDGVRTWRDAAGTVTAERPVDG